MRIAIIDDDKEVPVNVFGKNIIVVNSEIPIRMTWNLNKGESIWYSQPYPETGLNPEKQIAIFNEGIKSNSDVILFLTNSDFIVKELNIFIMQKKIDYRNVFSYTYHEDGRLLCNDVNDLGVEIPFFDNTINRQNALVEELYFGDN